MAVNGVKTTDLVTVPSTDALLGNHQGSTVQISAANVAAQIRSDPAFSKLPSGAFFNTYAQMVADVSLNYSSVQVGDHIFIDSGMLFTIADASATDQHATTQGGLKVYESGVKFTTRARFSQAVARGEAQPDGIIIDAGGTLFISDHTDSTIPDLAGYKILGPITPQHFGPTGTTDDGPVIQKMFDWVSAHAEKRVMFRGHYQIETGVYIPDPHNIEVDAVGAFFETSSDILMFDLNGRADPTYVDNESRQNFNWNGGNFKCTLAAPTKATAFRWMGFRNSTLRPSHFEGFHTNIIAGGKDTLRVGEFKSYDCQHVVLFPPWSAVGGPMLMNIHDVHMSHALHHTPAIKSYIPLTDSVIQNVSLNLGTGAAHQGAIDLRRDLLFGVVSITGTFTAGETVTGGTSGATFVFDEHYTHPFPFQFSQPLDWLIGTDKSVANFVAGETLTGGTSGATAVIENNAAYIVQNPTWQNFKIGGANHFEAGSGAAGAIAVMLRDRIKRGQGSLLIDLDLGSVGVNGGGSVGLQIENMDDVVVSGRFSQTSGGGGVPIKTDALCDSVKIKKTTKFSSGVIDLNGMPRTELDLSDFNVTYSLPQIVTGWSAKAVGTVATNSGAMIDLAADFPKYKTVGGIGPIAADMRVMAKDTGSAGAAVSRPRFRIHHPDHAASAGFHELNIRGVPDSEPRQAEFTVGLSASGQIEYDSIESGASALSVSAWVTGLRF